MCHPTINQMLYSNHSEEQHVPSEAKRVSKPRRNRSASRSPVARAGPRPVSVSEPSTRKCLMDMATFTHAKQRNESPPISKSLRDQMRGTLAGQDYVMTIHIGGDVQQTIFLNLDGHGEHGEMYSVAAGEYLSQRFEAAWTELREFTRGDFQTNGGSALVKMIFLEIDDRLRETLQDYYAGGTTATVVMLIDGIHLVTANVGDSPAMLAFDDGRAHLMLTEGHSADSPEEYTRYCARCTRDGKIPAQFVYNRFNCSGGHKLPGPHDDYQPLPIFELNDSNEAVVITENSEYVATLGYHGGIQSVRKYVVKDRTGEAIDTQADKRYLNWGSTVAGRPQNTRMLGDFDDKVALHLDAEPSVSVVTLDRTMGCTWLILASDGIADAHWFENLASGLVTKSTSGVKSAQSLTEAIVIETIANAREANFTFRDNLPAWDDLSLTLVSFPREEKVSVLEQMMDYDEDQMMRTGSGRSGSSREGSPYSRGDEYIPMEVEPSVDHGPIRRHKRCAPKGQIGSYSAAVPVAQIVSHAGA